jgi:glycosyltransferase involved in cell wall biosynthesis
VGGPAQHVLWLTGRLDSDRFETLLVVGKVEDNETSMDYFAEKEGVGFLCVPEMQRRIGFKDLLAIFKIYKIISDFEPDIIHTHTSKAGFLGGLSGIFYNVWRVICKKKITPIIHTFHGHTFQGYFSPLRERIFRSIERFLSHFPLGRQVILTLTPGQREDILRYLRLNNKRDKKSLARSVPDVRIMPLGIDLKPFVNISNLRGSFRKEFGISADTLIVGWVGRLTAVKNPSLFLEAVSICKKRCIQPVRFVIAGEGELRKVIQQEINARGISDSVMVIGNRRDMRSLMADIDILASTSNNEGTPVSMLEAIACYVGGDRLRSSSADYRCWRCKRDHIPGLERNLAKLDYPFI